MTNPVADEVQETGEDIPLKSGTKSLVWYTCNEDCFSGARFVNVAFGTLTLVITVALLVQIYYGDYQVVPHGSVATDSLDCSKIGTSILKKGGNSIDAAIASAFCLAVATPHVTGLDAEGQMMIYNHRTRTDPTVLDFTAPSQPNSKLPRLVTALIYAHQQYGSLRWKDLVEPAANLAKTGYLISRMLVQAISAAHAEDLYSRLEPGQILRHEKLGDTLMEIANFPEEDLYSFISPQNQPKTSLALKTMFHGYNIFVPKTPSAGPALIINLKQIEKFNFTTADTLKPEYTYRLAETTQLVYDELNITSRLHRGTSSNVAVMDLHDNYVSLVTGMYQMFGSGETSEQGYVLDVKNKTKPCSRVPLIVTDANMICGKRMIFASNDIDVATQLISILTIAKENATESIEGPRFHLINGSLAIEGSHMPFFSEDVQRYLGTLSSKTVVSPEPYYSSNIVEKLKDELTSHSDSRGGGIASRF